MKRTIVLLLALGLSAFAFADVSLPKIFGDNMVLQRNKPISIWGWAKPGEVVSISFHKQTKKVTAGTGGKWKTLLTPEAAGGPYTLTIAGSNTISISNVLVGEVWICSGQSNMEMQIEGWGKIDNYEKEIAAADYPMIRHFKVPNTVSTTLKDDVTGGEWKVANPANAGDFSATAFFFARELYKKLKVPIGLINTSWGGTQSEAWTSQQAFEQSPQLKYVGDIMKSGDITTLLKKRGEDITNHVKKLQGSIEDNAATEQYKNADYDDSKWPHMKVPGLWESSSLPDLDGTVWFRKTINISDADAGKEAVLELSVIDDNDETFVNGTKVGGINLFNAPRKYTIPAGILKAGKNVIAVKIEDTGGAGGIYGNADDVKITIDDKSQSLAGDWQFKVAVITPPSTAVGPNSYPSLLYNAMINPLLPYTIEGAIWYQGESNAGRAYQYRTAFPLMIKDWRNHWKQGNFPFYFVQLSTFGAATANSNSGSTWAELREAQALTLSLPNTGMATTTDIGNPTDIHPKNKQDVGLRLAKIALHDVYKKKGEYLGPQYNINQVMGNKVQISFTHTGSGLQIKEGKELKGFEIAGADEKFYPATATITGDMVVVQSDEVKQPMSVRYNWVDDASAGNLFNKEGLPAAPFRTDSWPGVTVKTKYEVAR